MTKDDAKQSKKILETALARFKIAAEAESENRKLHLEDLKFRAGEQWPAEIRKDREQDGRPCLVVNRIPQFVQQVTNDQRQNRPTIKVFPVDDKADVETAKIFQGITRHILQNSNAEVAFDTAFESAVVGGRGFFRVLTDYKDPLSFDQEILIKRVRNPFNCYLDPSSQEPDGSDANWGFVFEDLTKKEFESAYPDKEIGSDEDFASIGDNFPEWMGDDHVRVAEYFYKEFRTKEIALLSDGSTVLVDELPEFLPEGIAIEKTRKTQVPVIRWLKINAKEILEETEWLGRWIPIIPVIGQEIDIEGKQILEGVIRHAKDPQRMYNYWTSSETETIALAPRAPFVGVEGQFEGHELQWQQANRKNFAFLQYKPISIAGQPAPAPSRNVYEPPVQAITQAKQLSADDMKATTGIYDASLGARSNENSGIAIQRRNLQSQTSNFHFVDNLARSIRHLGRILVDLIPKVYDTAQAVRILGEDDQAEIIKINEVFERNGKLVQFNLGVGKYDVICETGPSFATKRQEAAASMVDVSKANPKVMEVAGDLVVKNMDWPGATEIAERLKKTLPPGLADDQKKQPLPPEAQAQMAQMNQMIEKLTASLNEANKRLETKAVEIESRERIEMAKLQAQIEMKLAEIGSRESEFLLKQKLSDLDKRLQLLDINEPIEEDIFSSPQSEAQEHQQEMNGAGPSGAMAQQFNNQLPGELSPAQFHGDEP